MFFFNFIPYKNRKLFETRYENVDNNSQSIGVAPISHPDTNY